MGGLELPPPSAPVASRLELALGWLKLTWRRPELASGWLELASRWVEVTSCWVELTPGWVKVLEGSTAGQRRIGEQGEGSKRFHGGSAKQRRAKEIMVNSGA